MRKNIFFVESRETPVCPICGNPLDYRDSCLRSMKIEGGEQCWILIHRLRCSHCRKINRELPDCLTPYKQYSTEIISGVLDGIVSSSDDDSEDFPCEMTMKRWRLWMKENELRIDGYLKSVGYRMLGFGEELLKSSVSLFSLLRSSSMVWLETILRFIYNSGGFLMPY